MSGLEIFAVVGAVAAVISAYRDGGQIVAEIKKKRARRKALPPPKLLEDSLSRGPPALEEAKNNGVERFGQAFAVGDRKSPEFQDVVSTSVGRNLRPPRQRLGILRWLKLPTCLDEKVVQSLCGYTSLSWLYARSTALGKLKKKWKVLLRNFLRVKRKLYAIPAEGNFSHFLFSLFWVNPC